VTSLLLEHFGTPSSAREVRQLERARRRAVDELAGRTVWSASALPAGHASADRLGRHLRWAGEDRIAAGWLEVEADESLRRLAGRLDAMLQGSVSEAARPDRGDSELYARGVSESEALMADAVGLDDVVVLHDSLTAVLVQAIRERGAHVVLQVSVGPAGGGAMVEQARAFLRPYTDAVDAYLMTWTEPAGRGQAVQHLAALMPSPAVVAAKEIRPQESGDVGWASVLADVVRSDRGECVGGTLHARPTVAAR
jgi:trehalose synthase